MSAIEERLDHLPRKIAQPFRALLCAGHLDGETLSVILDAGELAGDTTKLLAFATSYFALSGQQVPVRDVIRMAKAQKRKIKLSWSAKRWKAEHDRLSRAEALSKLAGENILYDVSAFERHLPQGFRGYLIRSSRRLGMEGLRQRHCVAGYHTLIKAGTTAIAAVFVGRKRWTVELFRTHDEHHPLRIGQIKSRYNENAAGDVRSVIHDLLGISTETRPPLQEEATGLLYRDTLNRILPVLRGQGIQEVTVQFDGSGDSGSIDTVECETGMSLPAEVTVECRHIAREFADGRWVPVTGLKECSLEQAIQDLTYDYLDEAGVDWYNNDGGYGELVIDVAAETVSLSIDVRQTYTDCAFDQTLHIPTGDPV